MTDDQSTPPRIAQLLLNAALRPRDVESITGDLLEEYRDVRRPSLGRRRADAWYAVQVLSVFGRLVWPFALALIIARSALALIAFPLSGSWNPSLVPAPNVSALDAAFFLASGYYGAHRTGRIATGVLTAGALGVIDFAVFAVYAILHFPTLPAAMWEKPFIVVIGCTFFAIALTFAVALGALGATAGRWSTTTSARSA